MSGTSMGYHFWSQVAVTLFHYSSLHLSLLSYAYFTYLCHLPGPREALVSVTFDANKNVVRQINAGSLAEHIVSWVLKKVHGDRGCA